MQRLGLSESIRSLSQRTFNRSNSSTEEDVKEAAKNVEAKKNTEQKVKPDFNLYISQRSLERKERLGLIHRGNSSSTVVDDVDEEEKRDAQEYLTKQSSNGKAKSIASRVKNKVTALWKSIRQATKKSSGETDKVL